jgi:hypothetical protein
MAPRHGLRRQDRHPSASKMRFACKYQRGSGPCGHRGCRGTGSVLCPKAQRDPELAALPKFQAEQSSYSRSDIVIKAGWATLGSDTMADAALARACSEKFHSMKTS